MTKTIIFTISFLTFFFVLLMSFSIFSDSEPQYIKIADKVRENTVRKIERKYNIRQVGTFDGMIDCVQCLGAAFESVPPLLQDEARSLIVEITQDFLSGINGNAEIKPYLKNHPFLVENIKIKIFFFDKNGKGLFDPYLSVISTFDGKIYYKTDDPDDKNKYKNIYEETYKETVAILKSQK